VRRWVIQSFLVGLSCVEMVLGQRTPDPNKGDPNLTQWGIMDGNRVRTLYANHGEIADWPNQPSGEWPKGSGRSYVDGVAVIVSARAIDTLGNPIHPMETNYREFIDLDPVTKIPWGWAPVPGYSNPRNFHPARSDDPSTWPPYWPDKLDETDNPGWPGLWNGFFGMGVTNADLETYFVFDDAPDEEWLHAREDGSGVFYPDYRDSTRGGLGMEVAARGFQWSHVLAQDILFWYYEITNEGTTDYDSVYFAQYIDWGIGGTDDSGDDEGGYNTYLDIAFAWDFDEQGSPGHWTPVGTAAYAFLESPGNAEDGYDNDEDGITDEMRDPDPGILIQGQDQIAAYVESHYDRTAFEMFYGALEHRYPYVHGYWWTGDEDMDWRSYLDLNENGQWDPGEPLNDDVGSDGLGPNDPNYPGPDPDGSEANGRPDQGEPDFGQTDKDESDQIGLTGFKVFNVHDYELTDDEQDWRVFTALQPPEDVYLEGGRNLGMFFSSGAFPMRAGQTERFSMALIFARKDFPDAPTNSQFLNSSLARKKQTVQQIYNADYRFSKPPEKPHLTAVPGDGEVVLYWDSEAERSFDPFLQEFDFEGYKLYRSTEPFFSENLIITNGYGEPQFRQPIFQCDKVDQYEGFHPVAVEGAEFYLGSNSGLRHFYVDRDVINGVTYYYALVAYDYGQVLLDADSNVVTDDQGHPRGIAPSECTATIQMDLSGNVETDINTVAVTPGVASLGYDAPELLDVEHLGPGTGKVEFSIVNRDSLLDGHQYELEFIEYTSHYNATLPWFRVWDLTSGLVLVDTLQMVSNTQEISVFDGISGWIENDTLIQINWDSTGWLTGSRTNYAVSIYNLLEDGDLNAEFGSRAQPLPDDFLIQFEGTIVDTSMKLGLSRRPTLVPFRIYDLTQGRYLTPGVAEVVQPDTNRRDGIWQVNEPILILAGDSAWHDPVYAPPYNFKVCWSIHLDPPDDPALTPVPPQAGDVLRIVTTKPFRNGEKYRFTVRAGKVDSTKLADQLDQVYVVPNPYVVTSIFEARNPYVTGRHRKLYFMNLPQECDIDIYTMSGHLVTTLEHRGASPADGQEAWDLTNREGMNIAYGVYFYVVRWNGLRKAGRFAVIK